VKQLFKGRHLHALFFLFALVLACSLLIRGEPSVVLTDTADFAIYTDDLGPCWVDWSWGRGPGFDLHSTDEVYSGNQAIAVDLGDYGGLAFHHTDFDTVAFESLEFYIHGGEKGGQQLRVFLYGPGGGAGTELPSVSLTTYIGGGTVDAEVWKQVSIPITDWGVGQKIGSSLVV